MTVNVIACLFRGPIFDHSIVLSMRCVVRLFTCNSIRIIVASRTVILRIRNTCLLDQYGNGRRLECQLHAGLRHNVRDGFLQTVDTCAHLFHLMAHLIGHRLELVLHVLQYTLNLGKVRRILRCTLSLSLPVEILTCAVNSCTLFGSAPTPTLVSE